MASQSPTPPSPPSSASASPPTVATTTCTYFTVWKFDDFSVTQILREINFGDSRSAKYAISTHLEIRISIFMNFCTFCPKIA